MFHWCFYNYWGSLGIITRCKTRRKNQKKTLPACARTVCELQLLWGRVHLLCMETSRDCRWISAAPWSLMGCPLHHGLPHGLLGDLCSSTWGASLVSFFIDFGIYKAVSINIFTTPLSNGFCKAFSPFLKYVISERLPGSLVFSSLELGGTGCGSHGEVLNLFSQKTPLQSFCTKSLPN